MNDENNRNSISTKEITLLGLIAEEPIHAYGLEAKIVERRLDEWTEISTSSIYRVLTGLQDKGFIETEFVHEGQGATRKVHRLTPTGREALLQGVSRLLGEFSPIKNPFNIALAYLPYVDSEEAIAQLEHRQGQVEQWLTEIRAIRNAHNGCCPKATHAESEGAAIPPINQPLRVKLLFDHVVHHLKAEERFLLEALEFLRTPDGRALRVEDQPHDTASKNTSDHSVVPVTEESLS